jgi:hypothetical protein
MILLKAIVGCTFGCAPPPPVLPTAKPVPARKMAMFVNEAVVLAVVTVTAALPPAANADVARWQRLGIAVSVPGVADVVSMAGVAHSVTVGGICDVSSVCV